jgi:hypothetical protein
MQSGKHTRTPLDNSASRLESDGGGTARQQVIETGNLGQGNEAINGTNDIYSGEPASYGHSVYYS